MRFAFPAIALLASSFFLTPVFAFDDANDSTVDKADHFNFQDFHKDDGTSKPLWGKDSKDQKDDGKAITTYDNTGKAPGGQLQTEVVKPGSATASKPVAAPAAMPAGMRSYEKGQELKVRAAYKLSVDPSLASIPTLFDAIQNLHQQLGNYCPHGWSKEAEWHEPEAAYFYLYYRATCL